MQITGVVLLMMVSLAVSATSMWMVRVPPIKNSLSERQLNQLIRAARPDIKQPEIILLTAAERTQLLSEIAQLEQSIASRKQGG